MQPNQTHLWNTDAHRNSFNAVLCLGRYHTPHQLCYRNREEIIGSGNSSPVGHAKTVETEAHQDAFELRFDHIALGGTATILLVVARGGKEKAGNDARLRTPATTQTQTQTPCQSTSCRRGTSRRGTRPHSSCRRRTTSGCKLKS